MGSNAQTHLRSVPVIERAHTDVKLTLPARAENVSVIRHVLGAFAEALRLSDDLVEDLRLAVTEACTNVVRHAYRNGTGPLEVVIAPSGHELTVVVTDHGDGLRPSVDSDGGGLGLPLMAALSQRFEIDDPGGGGSRVRMQFRQAE
jgi:serine/threonine-protein kinase RsbW